MTEQADQFYAKVRDRLERAVPLAPEVIKEIKAGRAFPTFDTLLADPNAFAAVIHHLQKGDLSLKKIAHPAVEKYLRELDAEQTEAVDAIASFGPELKVFGVMGTIASGFVGSKIDNALGTGVFFTALLPCLLALPVLRLGSSDARRKVHTHAVYENIKKRLLRALQPNVES